MSFDSVSSFLEFARANRLLSPDVVDELLATSHRPHQTLSELCDSLVTRGWLSPFQAQRVRAGHTEQLVVAGYPLVDEIGPCPGGTTYRAIHPSLQMTVTLRLIRADWFPPADTTRDFVQRAIVANRVYHPHVVNFLEVGIWKNDVFVVFDPFEAGDLQTLVTDIGPMPADLATKYVHKTASALHVAHQRGIVHGEVRPGTIYIGPLTPMSKLRADGRPRSRPGANAQLKLAELGLVPSRPALNDWTPSETNAADWIAYLPPERLSIAEPTTAGDVYGLGATFYYLLTGQPLYLGNSVSALRSAIETGSFPRLEVLRPDLPTELVALVYALLSTGPNSRPTAEDLIDTLRKTASASGPASGVGTPLAALVDEALNTDRPLVSDPIEVPLPGSSSDALVLEAGFPQDLKPIQVPYREVEPRTPATDATNTIDRTIGSLAAPKLDVEPLAPDDFNEWQESSPLHTTGYDAAGTELPDSLEYDSPPATKQEGKSGRIWLWLAIGLGLQIFAIALWVIYFFQPF